MVFVQSTPLPPVEFNISTNIIPVSKFLPILKLNTLVPKGPYLLYTYSVLTSCLILSTKYKRRGFTFFSVRQIYTLKKICSA